MQAWLENAYPRPICGNFGVKMGAKRNFLQFHPSKNAITAKKL